MYSFLKGEEEESKMKEEKGEGWEEVKEGGREAAPKRKTLPTVHCTLSVYCFHFYQFLTSTFN